MRILQERMVGPEGQILGEWEPCTRIDTRYMSEKEVTAWVREANVKAKREGEYVRFRSIMDDSGDNW